MDKRPLFLRRGLFFFNAFINLRAVNAYFPRGGRNIASVAVNRILDAHEIFHFTNIPRSIVIHAKITRRMRKIPA
jgi:hypothetical protein